MMSYYREDSGTERRWNRGLVLGLLAGGGLILLVIILFMFAGPGRGTGSNTNVNVSGQPGAAPGQQPGEQINVNLPSPTAVGSPTSRPTVGPTQTARVEEVVVTATPLPPTPTVPPTNTPTETPTPSPTLTP